MTNDYFLFVIDVVGGDYDDYRRQLFSGAARSELGAVPLVVGAQQSGRDEVPAMLGLGDADHVPSAQRSYLRATLPIAIDSLRPMCAKLPDEQTVEEQILVVAEEGGPIPRGTAVYVRKTNRATVGYANPYFRVDVTTGKTSYLSGVVDHRVRVHALLQADNAWGKTLLDSALTAATFVGFALPQPGGLILSTVAAVLQVIFGKLLSSGHAPITSEQLQDAVNQIVERMKALKLDEVNATIMTDLNWLAVYYNAAWDDEHQDFGDEETRAFVTSLSTKLQADTGLVQQVQLLMTSDYKVMGFPLFLLGAGLHLVMLKIALIYYSTHKRVVDTVHYHAFIDASERYVKHGNAVVQQMDQEIADRLAKVSPAMRNTECQITPGINGGGIQTCWDRWLYRDSETQKYPGIFPNTQREEGCRSYPVEHQAEAEASRTAYVDKLRGELLDKYYLGERDKALQTVAQWQSAREQFVRLAAP